MFGYEATLDWQRTFQSPKNEAARIGYLLEFEGCGYAALAKDLELFTPIDDKVFAPTYANMTSAFTKGTDTTDRPTVKAVGVLTQLDWNGNAGGSISLSFLVSKDNALVLRKMAGDTPSDLSVKQFACWIANFESAKNWYEEFFPNAPPVVAMSEVSTKGGHVQLTVDTQGQKPVQNINFEVYHVQLTLVPSGKGVQTFYHGMSQSAKNIMSWGMKVGVQA